MYPLSIKFERPSVRKLEPSDAGKSALKASTKDDTNPDVAMIEDAISAVAAGYIALSDAIEPFSNAAIIPEVSDIINTFESAVINAVQAAQNSLRTLLN